MVQTNTGCAKREHRHLLFFKAQVQPREQTSTITSSCIGIAMVDCLTYLGIGWNSNDRTLPLPKCHVHGISLKKTKVYTLHHLVDKASNENTSIYRWFTMIYQQQPPKQNKHIRIHHSLCIHVQLVFFSYWGFPKHMVYWNYQDAPAECLEANLCRLSTLIDLVGGHLK